MAQIKTQKQKQEKKIYNLSQKEIFDLFNASEKGLSEKEVAVRIKQFGKNKLERKRNWKWLKIITAQFNDIMVWILLIAAFLAFLFGEHRDVVIILTIISINSIIGFLQEFKAERILDSMKKLTTDKAFVLRDGEKKEIDSSLLVPGDIVLAGAGDSIPADGYILEAYSLKVNSFVFTGESKPEKKEAKILSGKIDFADIDNMVFMGESVSVGGVRFLVTETGSKTKLGKIAELAQEVHEEFTPMQKQMRSLGKQISVLAAFIGILVMIAGQYFEVSLYENFLFALAIAVSVVPVGLPAAISVALSLGMKKLLKYNVLAKKLNAVETLGSVSMICTDKTGTLTKNELAVIKTVVDGKVFEIESNGYEPVGKFFEGKKEINPKDISSFNILFKIGTLCNDAVLARANDGYKIFGDPTEGAIIVAGRKFSSNKDYFIKGEKKITENPFSSDRMMMSVVYQNRDKEKFSFVKGSPDVIIDLCKRQRIGDRIVSFSADDKKKARTLYNKMSSEALRVLAFAYKKLENNDPNHEKDLIWVGTMAMIDPPRKGVDMAISECSALGIRVMMITGDYEITARAIADNIGLTKRSGKNSDLVVNGKMISQMRDGEIYEKIKKGACVFARISPEQKLRIAGILKGKGQIIAMTGDGVNDAPALKRADIGVAMGIIGTDVSKEASDMILLDDNFSSIVNGVKEGRTIFQNLKKFVHYVLTSNASELFSVFFGVLFGLPAPITAIQILSIDLATDIFPSFSLGMEPPEPNQKNTEINSKKSIMTWKGFRRIIYLGVLMASAGVVSFFWSMSRGGWSFGESIDFDSALYIKSTSVTFAVLAMTQMANLVHSRSEKYSPFELGFFKNKFLIYSIFISIGILFSFMYVPLLSENMGMLPIDFYDWIAVLISVVVVYLFEAARKEKS